MSMASFSSASFCSMSSSSAEAVVCRTTPADTKTQNQSQLEEKIDRENKTSADDAYTAKIKASIEAARASGRKVLVETVVAALKDPNCKLTKIDLTCCNFGDAGAKAIAEALKDPHCNFTWIELSANNIGAAGAKAIAEALKDPYCKLTSIDLSSNKIGEAGAKVIAEALKHPNCKLTSIGLFGNNIGVVGAKAIAEALKDPNCKLTSIDLGYNNIGDTGAKAIATALTHPNCKFTSIELALCGIGDTGAIAIAEALRHPNCKLTSIGLSSNNIGDAGAIAIAEALRDPNCKFTSIDLSSNNIGVVGAIAIAEALRHPNCKLTSIGLSSNNIGEAGAKVIAEALKNTNCKFTSIDLSSNNIGVVGAIAIAEALRHPNCKLTSIGLSSNNIGDAGAIAIAEALKNTNCKLTSIDLLSNNIGEAGAKVIAEALKHPNCKLTSIGLFGNNIGVVGAKAIAQAVVFCRKQGRDINVIGIDNFASFIAAAEKEEKEREEKELREKLEISSKAIVAGSSTKVPLPNCTVLDPSSEAKPRNLTVTDLKPIFTALNDNKSVTTIDLSNNSEIDAKVIEPLMQVLSGDYGWGWFGNTFSTPDPNAFINCIDLRGTKVTKTDAERLFNHAKSLVIDPPRTKFTVFYSGGELKLESAAEKPKEQAEAKESKDTKDEKKATGPSLLQTLTPALQPLAALTSNASVSSAPQALAEINASYRTQQTLISENKNSATLEQSINKCTISAISKVKQNNALDVAEKKASTAIVQPQAASTVAAAETKAAVVNAALVVTQAPTAITAVPQAEETASSKQQQEIPHTTAQVTSKQQQQAQEEKKAEKGGKDENDRKESKETKKSKEEKPAAQAPETTSASMMQFIFNSAQSFSDVAQNLVETNTAYMQSFFASEPLSNANASISQEHKESKETETKLARSITSTQSSVTPLSLSEQEAKTAELLNKAITEQINSLKQEIAKQTVLVDQTINQTQKGLTTTNTNLAAIATTQVTQTIKLEEQKQLLQQQEHKLHQLVQYANAKEKFNLERNNLLNDSNPAIPSFYNCFRRYFCAHLQTFFLAQTGIFEQKLGAVSDLKDESNLRSVASKIGTVTLKLLAVDVSAIPIIGTIMSPITAGAKLGIRSRDNTALEAVNSKLLDFMPSTFEDLAHVLAKEVIATYREQIELLTPESARRFAECGVIKIISALFYDQQIKEESFMPDALAILRTMEVSQRQVSLCGFTIGVPMNQPLDTHTKLPDDFIPTDAILYRQTGLYIAGATPRDTKYYSNDKRSYDREAHERPPKPKHTETFASYIGYIKTEQEPLDTMVLDSCNLKVKRAEDARRAQGKQEKQGEQGTPPAITAISTSSIATDQSPSIVVPLSATSLVTEASAATSTIAIPIPASISASTSTPIPIPTSTPMPTPTSINTTADSSVAVAITRAAATITSEPPYITTDTSAVSSASVASAAVPERSMVAPSASSFSTGAATSTTTTEDISSLMQRLTLLKQEHKEALVRQEKERAEEKRARELLEQKLEEGRQKIDQLVVSNQENATLKEKMVKLEQKNTALESELHNMQKQLQEMPGNIVKEIFSKTREQLKLSKKTDDIFERLMIRGLVSEQSDTQTSSSSLASSPATIVITSNASPTAASVATNSQENISDSTLSSSTAPSTLSKIVPGGCILS